MKLSIERDYSGPSNSPSYGNMDLDCKSGLQSMYSARPSKT